MSKPSMKSWAEAATMSNDKADTIGEQHPAEARMGGNHGTHFFSLVIRKG